MPTLFKKIVLSFLTFAILFVSVAPYLTAKAQSCGGETQFCCTTGTACQPGLSCVAAHCVLGNACGSAGQACCTGNTCDSGLSCTNGSCTAGPSTGSPIETTGTSYWYSPGLFEFYGKVYDTSNNDIFGERYTYAQVVWILESIPFALLGINPESFTILRQMFTSSQTGNNISDEQQKKLAELQDPFLYIINQFYLMPPASGTRWLSQKINNFSIVKHAYAQSGFGYTSLQLFQPLWTASRNVAYILMIIVLIAISFGIMFRMKISPQVVVSVQSALPKIITTLVLITFSYAIAGFLIDLMYLIFGAILWGISNSGSAIASLGLNPDDLWKEFLNSSILDKAWSSPFTVGAVSAAGGTSIIGIVLYLLLSSSIPGIGTVLAGALIPFVLGLIVTAIIYFFKVFIMLAQVYLSLVINIIFGPLILLAEAIPFIEANAMGWFRTICADVTVFLAVGLIFIVQTLLSGVFKDGATSVPWAPPYLGFHPIIMRLMIWIGVWSILPNVKDVVYAMFKRKSPNIETPREFSGMGQRVSQSWDRFREGMRGIDPTRPR